MQTDNWEIFIQAVKSHRSSGSRGIKAISISLGIPRVTIQQWIRMKKIPAEQVLDFERLLGVHRSIIRSDIYPPSEYLQGDQTTKHQINITITGGQAADVVVTQEQ